MNSVPPTNQVWNTLTCQDPGLSIQRTGPSTCSCPFLSSLTAPLQPEWAGAPSPPVVAREGRGCQRSSLSSVPAVGKGVGSVTRRAHMGSTSQGPGCPPFQPCSCPPVLWLWSAYSYHRREASPGHKTEHSPLQLGQREVNR